jgi:hypothetical protein
VINGDGDNSISKGEVSSVLLLIDWQPSGVIQREIGLNRIGAV